MTENRYPARFLSSYDWTGEGDTFGGYSGITLTPDGRDFILLSDRSHLVEGSIFRHGDRIIGVRSREIAPLHFPDTLFEADPKREPDRPRDTEGLAVDTQGRLLVSVESDNRILRKSPEGVWERLPGFPRIEALPPNRGLEALAVSRDGDVLALPEVSERLTDPFPLFRYRDGAGWDIALRLSRSQGFVPVGADVGPDERLYVLERGFDGFGFTSRVRRFAYPSETVAAGETLLQTPRRRFDNLEGLAVWQAETGDLRLTMVSDDNFNRFQKTEIVEFGLP